ncbi:MAG: hypothetical protein RBS68_01225 [Anaerolineales bacterium]|jgi:hypothetical protein|nr:hypothetical protein [Anaerolineales bacterium]
MRKHLSNFLGFNRHSAALLSAFLLTCFLIVYIWWPLAVEYWGYVRIYHEAGYPWYRLVDWLLLGIFAFMSLTIVARADLRVDGLIILVGLAGGLVIESWGTQTNLWHYYTAERPPLWIIPAWPIASLSIDRITRALNRATAHWSESIFRAAYWPLLAAFYALMLVFVAPTFDKTYTWAALALSALLLLTPPSQRRTLLVFAAGSALGYFLERWGTTRECWTYYTGETPPVFAVFAHGMAAVAFWRSGLLVEQVWKLVTRQPGPCSLPQR